MDRKLQRHTSRLSQHEGALDVSFSVGQRVRTPEGLTGRVQFVTESFAPGNTAFQVVLDNGMGGGTYLGSQLRPVGEQFQGLPRGWSNLPSAITASLETEAEVVHLASDDYPEMGSILHDRPDPATQFQIIGGLRKTAVGMHEVSDEDLIEHLQKHHSVNPAVMALIEQDTPGISRLMHGKAHEHPVRDPHNREDDWIGGGGTSTYKAHNGPLDPVFGWLHQATEIYGVPIDGQGDAPEHGMTPRAGDPNAYDDESTEGDQDPAQNDDPWMKAKDQPSTAGNPGPETVGGADVGGATGAASAGGYGAGGGAAVASLHTAAMSEDDLIDHMNEMHGADAPGDFQDEAQMRDVHDHLHGTENIDEAREWSSTPHTHHEYLVPWESTHEAPRAWTSAPAPGGPGLWGPYEPEANEIATRDQHIHPDRRGNGPLSSTLSHLEGDDIARHLQFEHGWDNANWRTPEQNAELHNWEHIHNEHEIAFPHEPHPLDVGDKAYQGMKPGPMREFIPEEPRLSHYSSLHEARVPWTGEERELLHSYDYPTATWGDFVPSPHFTDAKQHHQHAEMMEQQRVAATEEQIRAELGGTIPARPRSTDPRGLRGGYNRGTLTDPMAETEEANPEDDAEHLPIHRLNALQPGPRAFLEHILAAKPDKLGDEELDEPDDGDVGHKVYKQLSKDFPPEAIDWVRNVPWSEEDVPLDEVDWKNLHHWTAWREPKKVAKKRKKIEKKLSKGKDPKRVVMVSRPGSGDSMIADGHHGGLAYAELNQPLHAYVAHPEEDQGPWDEMHAQQFSQEQEDGDIDQADQGRDLAPGEQDPHGKDEQALAEVGEQLHGLKSDPDRAPAGEPPGKDKGPADGPPAVSYREPWTQGSGEAKSKKKTLLNIGGPDENLTDSETGGDTKTKGGKNDSGKGKPPSRKEKKAALGAFEAAAESPSFAFHFTASWRDVVAKAKRIRASGGVRITASTGGIVVGQVRGDHDVYESGIQRWPGKPRSMAHWACGCPWASWHQDKAYPGHLNGRPCSHVWALQLEATARQSSNESRGITRTDPAISMPYGEVVVKSLGPWTNGGWAQTWTAPSTYYPVTSSRHEAAPRYCMVCGWDREMNVPHETFINASDYSRWAHEPHEAAPAAELPHVPRDPESNYDDSATYHAHEGPLDPVFGRRMASRDLDDDSGWSDDLDYYDSPDDPDASWRFERTAAMSHDELYQHLIHDHGHTDAEMIGWAPHDVRFQHDYEHSEPGQRHMHAEHFQPYIPMDEAGGLQVTGPVGREYQPRNPFVGSVPAREAAAILIAAGVKRSDVGSLLLMVTADQANAPWGSDNTAPHPQQKPYGATEPPQKDMDPGSYGLLAGPDPENWGEINPDSATQSGLRNEGSVMAPERVEAPVHVHLDEEPEFSHGSPPPPEDGDWGDDRPDRGGKNQFIIINNNHRAKGDPLVTSGFAVVNKTDYDHPEHYVGYTQSFEDSLHHIGHLHREGHYTPTSVEYMPTAPRYEEGFQADPRGRKHDVTNQYQKHFDRWFNTASPSYRPHADTMPDYREDMTPEERAEHVRGWHPNLAGLGNQDQLHSHEHRMNMGASFEREGLDACPMAWTGWGGEHARHCGYRSPTGHEHGPSMAGLFGEGAGDYLAGEEHGPGHLSSLHTADATDVMVSPTYISPVPQADSGMASFHERQDSFPYVDTGNTAGPSTSIEPRDPNGIRFEEALRRAIADAMDDPVEHLRAWHEFEPPARWLDDPDTLRRRHEQLHRIENLPHHEHHGGRVTPPGPMLLAAHEEARRRVDEARRRIGDVPVAESEHRFNVGDHVSDDAFSYEPHEGPLDPVFGALQRALDEVTSAAAGVPQQMKGHEPADEPVHPKDCTCTTCEYNRYHAKHSVPIWHVGGIDQEAPQLLGGLGAELHDKPEGALDPDGLTAGDVPIGGGSAGAGTTEPSPADTASLGEFGAARREQLRARFGFDTGSHSMAATPGQYPLEGAATGGGPGMSMHDEDGLGWDEPSIQTIGNQQWSGGGSDSDEVSVEPGMPSGTEQSIIAAFQASAAAKTYTGNGGSAASNGDIAAASREFLQKTAVVSDAEAHELVAEGKGQRARNLDMLDLKGTHYEAEAAAMKSRGLDLDDFDDDLVLI